MVSLHSDRLVPQVNIQIAFLSSLKIDKFEMAQLYLELGKLPSEPQYWLEKFYELDSIYLAIYNRSNSIRVEPPSVYWDHCHPRSLDKELQANPEYETFMFYGRMMACPVPNNDIPVSETKGLPGFCSDGLEDGNDLKTIEKEFYKNNTFINCRKRECSNEEAPHYLPVPTTIDGVEYEPGIYCVLKFQLDTNMANFANDNGCIAGYNTNPYGICSQCYGDSSDCLLFTSNFAETDQYTINLYNYSQKEENDTVFYKDYRTESFNGFTKMVYLFEKKNLTNYFNSVFLWRFQRAGLSLECYILNTDRNNGSNYMVDVRGDYSLVRAKDFPQYNISKQRREIKNGSLTDLVCIKECDVGYFYEFESLSCRKCNLGCGICEKFDNCSKCIPGYNKIKESVSHKDIQEDFPVGFCRSGCQPGFHPERFKGTCRECPADCLRCRDKQGFEVNKSLELGISNTMYCIQCRDKNSKGEPLYSGTMTGECVNKCQGFGTFVKEVTSEKTKKTYRTCGRCFDLNCENCRNNSKVDACVSCDTGYSLQDDGRCAEFWGTEDGILLISLIVLCSMLILLVIGTCIVYVAIESPASAQESAALKRAITRSMTRLEGKKKEEREQEVQRLKQKISLFEEKKESSRRGALEGDDFSSEVRSISAVGKDLDAVEGFNEGSMGIPEEEVISKVRELKDSGNRGMVSRGALRSSRQGFKVGNTRIEMANRSTPRGLLPTPNQEEPQE